MSHDWIWGGLAWAEFFQALDKLGGGAKNEDLYTDWLGRFSVSPQDWLWGEWDVLLISCSPPSLFPSEVVGPDSSLRVSRKKRVAVVAAVPPWISGMRGLESRGWREGEGVGLSSLVVWEARDKVMKALTQFHSSIQLIMLNWTPPHRRSPCGNQCLWS